MNLIAVVSSWITRLVWLITWRDKMCPSCANLECVSNYGPCYSCRKGDNYQERMPDEDPVFDSAAVLTYQASFPQNILYLSAEGEEKVCCISDVYITNTVCNGRRLLRYIKGNLPAGWLPEIQPDE